MYIRVSTRDQNEGRQLEKAKELGLDERHIYIDKISGKDFARPKYQALRNGVLRRGDVLYVSSIDRFGRNYAEIIQEWGYLNKELGVDLVVLDMPLLDTRNSRDLTGTLISDIVLQLLSYVSQKERENIRERQREGIELAKAAGKYTGRKKIPVDQEKFQDLYRRWRTNEITIAYFQKEMGMSRNTLYRRIWEHEDKLGIERKRGKEKAG